MVTFQIGSDVTFQAVILLDQLDTMISSGRERAFLEAEMSVFSEDEFTEYFVDSCGCGR